MKFPKKKPKKVQAKLEKEASPKMKFWGSGSKWKLVQMPGILAVDINPTIHFPISLQDTSNKIVPMICTLLTDPEKPVREQAFKVAKGFIQKLEQVKWNTYCHHLLK